MRRAVLAFVVVVALAGCCHRAVHWSRPDATERDFFTEYAECEREGSSSSFCLGAVACIAQETQLRERWERCMRARGWIPTEYCRGRGDAPQNFVPMTAR